MSDKSFGDHPSKNIVKNPLLSSAVTGLCIEDLTHKAVLLPVTPSQGLPTRSDQQQGPQSRALGHTDHVTATLPSGDALQNINLSSTAPISNQNIKNTLDNQDIVKHDKNRSTTLSKASVRSDDDFDVNEYIARLQGTRYVSAPLHSHLKEDSNANLDATEENLEEINLNESQSPAETQQSLTADIAQNFSQLPTVLPHVASAVFSSFSNMLYKSREQTPDANPGVDQRYSEVQYQKPEMGVPMQVEAAPKEVGPPPKEPPVGGSSNFRLTTKKKYAQIPGLSSGDAQTIPFGGPMPFGTPSSEQNMSSMVQQNLPPIGQVSNMPPTGQAPLPPISSSTLPISTGINQSFIQNEPSDQKPTQFVPSASHGQTSAFVSKVPNTTGKVGEMYTPSDLKLEPKPHQIVVAQTQYNIFNPADNQKLASGSAVASESRPNVDLNKDNNYFTPIEHKEPANVPGTAIIPPPPMFSNLPRKDSLSTGKSVLPPSVARRISANQPIIKPQVSSTMVTENIFVPTIPAEGSSQAMPGISPSAFVPAPPNLGNPIVPPPMQKEEHQKPILIPKDVTPSKPDIVSVPLAQAVPPSYPTNVNISNVPSQFETAPLPPVNITAPRSTAPVSFFTPEGDKSDSQLNLPPPTFFNPTQSGIQDAPHPITQIPPNATPEPSRPIPEPPKATAGNFRMTKKRPQYYAGPIEGVGDISNSVKPTIPPVMPPTNFQGAFFTPAPVEQGSELFAAPIMDQSSVPFDISRPVNVMSDKQDELNISQDYSAFHLRQGQNQSYDQDFNTSFDLSRATTDAYDPPKSESKGFGIIGSLKSKLSSIDINKIQNSVTTFFDPAYNDTKVADPAPQEIQHFGQYGGAEQNNLEIFVGNQNTSYNNYNQQYYQTQQCYGQDYASSYFSDPNASQTQTAYSDNSANTHYAYTQQNIPDNAGFQNVDSFYNPNEFGQKNTEQTYAHDPAKVSLTESRKEESVPFFNPTLPQHQDNKNIPQSQTNVQFSISVPGNAADNPAWPNQQMTIENPIEVTTTSSPNVSVPAKFKGQEAMAFYNPNSFVNQRTQKEEAPINMTGSDEATASDSKEQKYSAGSYDSALNTDKYSAPNNEMLSLKTSHSNTSVSQNITVPSAKMENQESLFYNRNVFVSQGQNKETPFNIAESQTSSSKDKNIESNDSALNTDKYSAPNLQTRAVSYSNTNVTQNISAPQATVQENVAFYNPNVFVSQGVLEETPLNVAEFQITSSSIDKTSDSIFKPSYQGYVESCDSALNTDKYNFTSIQTPDQPSLSKETLVSAASFFDKPQTVNLPFSENITQLTEEAPMKSTEAEGAKNLFESKHIDTPIAPIGSKSKTEINKGSEGKTLIKSLSKDNIPAFGVSSVPLFGLSTLIADATKEADGENVSLLEKKPFNNLFEKYSVSFFENISKEQPKENHPKDLSDMDISVLKITDVKNVLLMEPPHENIGAVLKRNSSSSKLEANAEEVELLKPIVPSFDHQAHLKNTDNPNESFFKYQSPVEHQENVQKTTNLDAIDSELNICETCREVNTPEISESEPKEEDVTTQLIENLTSRIRLSHPLTVPFTESDVPQVIPQFTEQLQEITDIAEDTIETLQVQSATELLDDNIIAGARNYGWIPEAFPNIGDQYAIETGSEIKEHDNVVKNAPTVPTDHDCDFKLDPNAIGFFGNNSLFFENVPQNASDEIKAEIKNSHEDVVLPRQMSIPSAPPAEDDSKSDETGGLDVHSIEQDAKNDFPLDEEFVIEPSETDDDKIEFRERKRSSEDSNSSDTFTNRIERFKKTADHFADDAFEQSQIFNSPPISMASYFDTGNYAVESHYKNSLSPAPIPMPIHAYHRPSFEYIRIPPGFEEQFKNIFVETKPAPETPFIPDTSTQTKVTTTPTFSTPQETKAVETFSQIFGAKGETQSVGAVESSIPSNEPNAQNVQPLADPINFFAKEPEPEKQEAESFNRLASYFSMPAPQPDHSKSFFELSESQNHYRHEIKPTEENKKHFFELSQSQNHYIDDVTKNNIADLMMDLTSPQNMREQIVATVNHFTVELDSNVATNAARPIKIDANVTNLANSKPELDKLNSSIGHFKLVENSEDSEVVLGCEHCAKHIELPSKFRVRTAVNNNDREGTLSSVMTSGTKETSSKKSVSINVESDLDKEAQRSLNVMNEPRIASEYTPVKHHWFYRVDVEDKSVWRGFSVTDSKALEDAYTSPDLEENTLVATDGGRYDVNIVGRLRIAVYWKEKPTNVRRCSWYYKGTTDSRYVPYTEKVAEKLEEEYRHGVLTGEWHRKLSLPNSEMVIMHGPSVMVHFMQSSATDAFTTPPQATSRPRVVRRGHEESEIEDCEPSRIEHLLLLCHGVGSACDLRFRSVEEVVDDFRTTSFQLLQSHYKNSYDNGIVNRIEVLPISWHAQLHSGETGVDSRLSRVTLDSIPRLRAFTNNTVLDVLFYTSPVFHQMIVETVCSEMNRVYSLFKARNPNFTGQVSLGGHSLGSVILYDLLCNQISVTPGVGKPTKTYVSTANASESDENYPQLKFHPAALYALGSPIAIFECIRGVESLGLDFQLPTCKNFFNIFHPYDPIAYRIEPLINSDLQRVKPDLIPHHKGRKRMHLELKDTMTRVGADLKQKLIESVRTTWNRWTAQPNTGGHLEKVVEEDIEKEQLSDDKEDKATELQATSEMLGRLNNGRRIDYVLQEAPLEMINEYLFAMSSHVGYWESEDTMLLMLREVYSSLGVQPDCTVPQQCMTVQRTAVDEATLLSETDHPSTSRGRAL